MKSIWIKLLPLILIIFLFSACTEYAPISDSGQYDETFPSQFLLGDVYVLKDRERIDGNIAGVGTKLIIEEGATVTGSISLIGGQMEILGKVYGDVNVFAGTTYIHDTSMIGGDINQIKHNLEIDPGAHVAGEINTFTLPNEGNIVDTKEVTNTFDWIRPSAWIIFEFVRNLSLIFINLLIVFLFKIPTLRVNRTLKHNMAVSWGVGLLVFFALPFVSLVLLISICLSPIGIILILTFLLANVWAWTGISLIIGNVITKWLKLDWAEEAKVVVGAVFLGLISTSLAFIPLIGLALNVTVSAVGIGGIVLSKFGTSEKIS
ncbi:MAG: polymer-forming cytoskeletal protein [Pelolinea sp.]|nr:polymer-forming cytoskeletal protein [Pelolinea sp.]